METYAFTFHYGQIYYKKLNNTAIKIVYIYIPLWLDLLSIAKVFYDFIEMNLHSTMVRFIIYALLYLRIQRLHLHSTMVRFIISIFPIRACYIARFTFHYGQIYYQQRSRPCGPDWAFTFHYGQIYYTLKNHAGKLYLVIYIPLWLDLLLMSILKTEDLRVDLHSTMVRFIIREQLSEAISKNQFTFHYGQIYYYGFQHFFFGNSDIYIPLWLDLLFYSIILFFDFKKDLHSTMVRFII